MSTRPTSPTAAAPRRRTVSDIRAAKGATPLVCLTSYTAPIARISDSCADIILVGDSLGMVLYGMDSTVPVTIDMMIAHGRAVVRVTQSALVVVDMPFGSYQESPAQAFGNAARIMKETGAGAVKLEGGAEMAETAAFLVRRGIPVMGHIGLQPQSVHAEGGYRVKGGSHQAQDRMIADAKALEKAGIFSCVLECVVPDAARRVAGSIAVPVIGIGAGPDCDGQILVAEDILGLSGGRVPKFVKKYRDLAGDVAGGIAAYAAEVRTGAFPGPEHTYSDERSEAPAEKPPGRRVR